MFIINVNIVSTNNTNILLLLQCYLGTSCLILIIFTQDLCLYQFFVVFFFLNYEIKIDWNNINSDSFINHTWINACHISRPIYNVNINSLFNIIIHVYSFFFFCKSYSTWSCWRCHCDSGKWMSLYTKTNIRNWLINDL